MISKVYRFYFPFIKTSNSNLINHGVTLRKIFQRSFFLVIIASTYIINDNLTLGVIVSFYKEKNACVPRESPYNREVRYIYRV